MIKSPEWKAIAVTATVAFVSMSLLAVDAALDLNVGGLTQRLQSAQASFVDTMGQYQLAFAVPAWTRSKVPAGVPLPAQPPLNAQPLTMDGVEDSRPLGDQRSRKHLVDF